MPRTSKTQSDLCSFIPPGWNQTLHRSSQALLIHPTPYLPIIFTIAQYNHFGDLEVTGSDSLWAYPHFIGEKQLCLQCNYSWCQAGTAWEGSVFPENITLEEGSADATWREADTRNDGSFPGLPTSAVNFKEEGGKKLIKTNAQMFSCSEGSGVYTGTKYCLLFCFFLSCLQLLAALELRFMLSKYRSFFNI